jgi:hypothetical protein
MAEFEDADLRGARFRQVNLSDARFEAANFTNAKFSDVWLVNVEIDGMIGNLTINGVDVTPYVSAELARINPERALIQPTDPEGMLASWREISSRWEKAIERAQLLPEAARHEMVDGEFSFVQTLRHLVFAIDKWFTVPILGGEFDPIGLPNTGSLDFPWPGLDYNSEPTFDEALAVRRDRGERFAAYLARVDPGELLEPRDVLENGPASVQACVHTVLEEEVAHLSYATRDLDVIESR